MIRLVLEVTSGVWRLENHQVLLQEHLFLLARESHFPTSAKPALNSIGRLLA